MKGTIKINPYGKHGSPYAVDSPLHPNNLGKKTKTQGKTDLTEKKEDNK